LHLVDTHRSAYMTGTEIQDWCGHVLRGDAPGSSRGPAYVDGSWSLPVEPPSDGGWADSDSDSAPPPPLDDMGDAGRPDVEDDDDDMGDDDGTDSRDDMGSDSTTDDAGSDGE
jgi:hypothetical protein